jgi:glycogen operon protein
MSDEEWNHAFARSLGVWLGGTEIGEVDARGRPVRDDDFLVLFNAHHEPIDFALPAFGGNGWTALIDTARDGGDLGPVVREAGSAYPVEGRSLVVLRKVPAPARAAAAPASTATAPASDAAGAA